MAGGGRTGAWSVKTNDKGQWIQVDLGKIMEVTKMGMQGRQDNGQWVTEYRMSYSTDGQHFTVQNQVGRWSLFCCKKLLINISFRTIISNIIVWEYSLEIN